MYKNFYLMQKEPFDSHPSPELFYKSTAHQNGWNFLLQGIKNNEPIILMTGEYGAGKTLLYLKLMKLLETKTNLTSICLSTPTYSFIMVLEKILVELGISLDGIDPSDEARLEQAIYDHFEKKTEEKKKFIYIVIDDAQEFTYSFIYKLRLFASYNFSGYFPIRIILFSHPSFLKVLNHKKILAFGQRIKRIYFLKTLGFEETREYIYFRLIHSGATGSPIFEDEAIRFIQTISKGTPRLINNICDNCLLVASSEKRTSINQSLVEQAMAIGNLVGFEKKQPPQDSSSALQDERNHLGRRPSPAQPAPAPAAPAPAARAPGNTGHKNKKSQDENNRTRVVRVKKFEDAPIEKRAKKRVEKKSGMGNIGSRYGKISIIIILVLIILFLFFYLFNRSKANQMYNFQSGIEQTHRSVPDSIYSIQDRLYSMPDHLYTVENSDMFKKINKNTLSLNLISKKNKLIIEKKYQPIILMGNLM